MTFPHRVLVVDDDREIRETVVELLEEKGYEAIGAADGAQALELLREPTHQWCVVLLDLMMPIMDGRAFREAQLDDPRLSRIPVVVLSAVHDVDRAALELGVNAHMTKPVHLTELLKTIQRFCPISAA